MKFQEDLMPGLWELSKAIEILRKDVGEELPIRYVDILLYVHQQGEVFSLGQLSSGIDMEKSSASRAVKKLADVHGLLTIERLPGSRGERIAIRTTEKANLVLDRIAEILRGRNGQEK